MNFIKAFTLAATRSGAGKTTLTIGILAALRKRGVSVQPFKAGPDFIDPTLHKFVTGSDSYNLDLKMMGKASCQRTFTTHASSSEIAVIEGVMGLYDGGDASTASLSKVLGTPVILVIDAKSSAESTAAVLCGFAAYDPGVRIAGVIFNRIGSQRHRYLIERAVNETSSIPILGFMPRDIRFEIPERHLGLVMGEEHPLSLSDLNSLAETVEEHLDLDRLLAMTTPVRQESAPGSKGSDQRAAREKIRIAVAMDRAFCFYYKENFELFEQTGFTIVPFSPLHDSHLPEKCGLIYFGGGYPELYARELADNSALLEEIREQHDRNIPIYGECGGFMYLCNELIDMQGVAHRMTSLFPWTVVMNKRLRRLGYRSVEQLDTTIFGEKGVRLYGHEFHYSHIADEEEAILTNQVNHLYILDNNSYEGYHCGSAMGSYIHLHFGRNPEVVENIYKFLSIPS